MSWNKMQWLNHFYNLIESDPMRAALEARINYQVIDQEILAIAKQRAQSAASSLQIEQYVSTQMGSLGLSSTPNYGMGTASSGATMAWTILYSVAKYNGDPPATPWGRENAMAILQGRIPVVQVFRMIGDQFPLVRQILPMINMMAFNPSMAWGLDQICRLMGALALPRPQLLQLFGIQEQAPPVDPVDLARMEFTAAIENAEQYRQTDPARAEEILMHALKHARETPEPEDDIKALNLLMLLCQGDFTLTDDSVRRAVQIVGELVDSGFIGDELGQLTVLLLTIAPPRQLSSELDPILSAASETILGNELSMEVRIPLAQAGAASWLRQGEANRAQQLVRAIRQLKLSTVDQLAVAQIEADIYWEFGNRDSAADVLVEALEATVDAESGCRLSALQKLLCVWPLDRPDIEKYIDEVETFIKNVEEPIKTLIVFSTVTQLYNRDQLDRARRFAVMMDIQEMLEKSPPGMKSFSNDVAEAWVNIEASFA